MSVTKHPMIKIYNKNYMSTISTTTTITPYTSSFIIITTTCLLYQPTISQLVFNEFNTMSFCSREREKERVSTPPAVSYYVKQPIVHWQIVDSCKTQTYNYNDGRLMKEIYTLVVVSFALVHKYGL